MSLFPKRSYGERRDGDASPAQRDGRLTTPPLGTVLRGAQVLEDVQRHERG